MASRQPTWNRDQFFLIYHNSPTVDRIRWAADHLGLLVQITRPGYDGVRRAYVNTRDKRKLRRFGRLLWG